jgi:hypothetical protein
VPPRIVVPGAALALAPDEDAVQLPLLREEGAAMGHAGDRGGQRTRGALCVAPGGEVLIALAHHDSSDPLGAVLVELGCRQVVALDRGSRYPAFVHRAGTADLLPRYEPSVLVAIARPMVPRAFAWDPGAPVRQRLPGAP